ncbi:hypothetical protein J5N97_028207 [Dioscorea zingiberensis]|uniref:ABC1 atypical kinase-like domain-containing protein n=1 Tax=Dioscorea zingiberensis TaxID=325984 RepID=A0A9D5BYQ7_9LILI|nr:hypothetical protein J5N97_028207 [Dioscorea zingiberensis]
MEEVFLSVTVQPQLLIAFFKKQGGEERVVWGLQDVFVPKMYMDRTNRRVLVMEWVEGQKLSEVKDLYLVEVGVYCSLSQLLEHRFYHADPHHGNLLRSSDGKLAYLGSIPDDITHNETQRKKIFVRLLLSIDCPETTTTAMETVNLALEMKDMGVVGIDLSGYPKLANGKLSY